MKILVIGAAGRTGKAAVERAIAAGHQVTAFVRDAGELHVDGVRVVEGDATNENAVEAAIRDQDAVLDTVGGTTPYKQTTLETSVARVVITAMEAEITASALEWVILRPAILTDDPAGGRVRVYSEDDGEQAHKISRADLAAFIVDQLSSDEHLRRMVTIASS